jgi:hypothetical protein
MFIIPFIKYVKSINNINVHVFSLLTIGGRELWEEDDSLDIYTDILLPNDIYLEESPVKHNNIYYCKVDVNKTKIDDFYKWDEIELTDENTFCWKKYYTFGKEKYNDWLYIPNNEKLGKFNCESLFTFIKELN